jgi:hypothetical protein
VRKETKYKSGWRNVSKDQGVMKTIHRYSRDTIKNQVWEACIIEDGDSITLSQTHWRVDNCRVIAEVTKQISVAEAEDYKDRHKEWHIETYKTNVE